MLFRSMLVIVLIVKRKKFLNKTLEERKNLLSRFSKKDMKQEIQKLTSLENLLEGLTIMSFILEPERKYFLVFSPCKENHDQTQKPPIIPYYQKVLPQMPKCQPLPTGQTHIQKPLPCYMFDQASPSYSQNFPPLESYDHPQTNTKHV